MIDGPPPESGRSPEPPPATQGVVVVPAGPAVSWWRSAADGRVVWRAGSMAAIAGLTEDAMPASWLSLVHPDDVEPVARFDQDTADSVLLFRMVRPDGSIRWIRSRVIGTADHEGEPGWIGLAEDVTNEQGLVVDDRRAEDLLADIAARLMEVDVDGYDAALDASLAELGQLVSADRSYVFWLHDGLTRLSNTHEWCAAGVEPMLEHLQDLEAAEFGWFLGRLRGHDSAVISVPDMPDEASAERAVLEMQGIQSLALVPIEHGGRLRGFVGFDSVRDLRAWRPAQLGVLRRFAVLALAARHRTEMLRSLVEARDVAEVANEAKTRFISRASHELRTPLNAVVGFAELLEGPTTQAEREEFLGLLTGSARHLAQITTDLLDVLRTEATQADLTALADLARLVDGIVTLLEVQARDREVTIVVAPIAADVVVRRPDLVRQVLTNLMGNAVKYNRPGGRVELRVTRHGDRVELVVADTGIGIARELQHRLFAPFDRLGAEHGTETGTGLGLAIAHSAVESLGGTIAVESDAGLGTTITVVLPEPHPA